jgi:hypothetical protein
MRRSYFLAASGLIGMSYVVTCTEMLQGIMTQSAFQFIPDASRVKLHFHEWQIL